MSMQQGELRESTEAFGNANVPEPHQKPKMDVRHESIKCPRCGYSFITNVNRKCKLRTRVLIFVENGNTMGICPKCKTNLKVPVTLMSRLGLSHACHEKEGRT